MDNLEKQLSKVQELLFDLPEVKLYFSLREQIEANETLQTMLKEIRHHQKAMTAAMENIQLYQTEKQIYQTLMDSYHSHPLIVNYEQVKENVYFLLKQMQQIIE